MNHFYGMWHKTKKLVPAMKERGGYIVNVSSIAGLVSVCGFTNCLDSSLSHNNAQRLEMKNPRVAQYRSYFLDSLLRQRSCQAHGLIHYRFRQIGRHTATAYVEFTPFCSLQKIRGANECTEQAFRKIIHWTNVFWRLNLAANDNYEQEKG